MNFGIYLGTLSLRFFNVAPFLNILNYLRWKGEKRAIFSRKERANKQSRSLTITAIES